MALNIGSTAVTALKLGSADVSKLMLGDVQVWPAASAGPWTPLQLGAKLKHWLDFGDASTVTLVDGKVAAIRDKGPRGFLLNGTIASTRHAYTADANSGLSYGRMNSVINNLAEGPLMVVGGPVNGGPAIGAGGEDIRLKSSDGFCLMRVDEISYNTWLNGLFPMTYSPTGPGSILWNPNILIEIGGVPACRRNTVVGVPTELTRGGLNLDHFYEATGAPLMLADGFGGGGGWTIAGDHLEFVFTDPLTDGERQRLEGYVLHRWKRPDLLPANHPYKAAPPA